jgi:hypothetical protein
MKSIISSSKILFNNVTRNANLKNNNRFLSTSQQDWGVFPREREGNIYDVNWSLTEDGVVSTGDAFRNPRLPILTSRLSSKVQNGKVELTKPVYDGKYNLKEAGDTMNHNAFINSQSKLHEHLSSGQDLFIEDGSLGSYSPSRIGVRVVTDNSATSLISRSLLVSYYFKKILFLYLTVIYFIYLFNRFLLHHEMLIIVQDLMVGILMKDGKKQILHGMVIVTV